MNRRFLSFFNLLSEREKSQSGFKLKKKVQMTDIKIQMWSFPSLALWWAGAYSGQRNVNIQDLKDFDIFSER